MPDGSNFGFFEEESELPWPAALFKNPPFLGGGRGVRIKLSPNDHSNRFPLFENLKCVSRFKFSTESKETKYGNSPYCEFLIVKQLY